MLPAVQLYTQLFFVAIEVQYIRSHRILASEFQSAELPVAQQMPEQLFGVGLFFAEFAGKGEKMGVDGLFSLTRPSATLSRRERVFLCGIFVDAFQLFYGREPLPPGLFVIVVVILLIDFQRFLPHLLFHGVVNQ